MKVLVTGAAGQLGREVCRQLWRRGADCVAADARRLDVTDGRAVAQALMALRPQGVIHCAAWTAVDAAETQPERCMAVNAAGTANLAAACQAAGAKLLYVSTDYVFDGERRGAYTPEDRTGPLNVYGESKRTGERAVRMLSERYFIVRTARLFGGSGENFVRTMLRLGTDRRQLGVVADQIGSPTYARDLAKLLCAMIETEAYGIYHTVNEGACSWAELAERTFTLAGMDVRVIPLKTEDYPLPAARPKNTRLDTWCLPETGFCRLPPWQEALERYLREDE